MEITESVLTIASKNLMMRHLTSFQNNDLDALLHDYTEQSVFLTQKRTYCGIAEIRYFFTSLIVDFPSHSSKLEIDTLVIKDELAFIVWHAKTPTINLMLGTDSFLIKDGKIHQQTFVDMIKFTN